MIKVSERNFALSDNSPNLLRLVQSPTPTCVGSVYVEMSAEELLVVCCLWIGANVVCSGETEVKLSKS